MAGKFISPFIAAESVQQIDESNLLAPTPDMLLYDESTGGKEDQLLNDSLSEMDHVDQFDESLDEEGQIDISLAVKLAEKKLTTCDPDQFKHPDLPNEEKQSLTSSNPLKEAVDEKVELDAIEENALQQPKVKVMPVFGKKRKGPCKPMSSSSKENSTVSESISKEPTEVTKKPNHEDAETLEKCANEKQKKKQTKKLMKEQKTEKENKTTEKEVKKKEKEKVQEQKKAEREKKLAEKEAKKMEMEQRNKEQEKEQEQKIAEKENKKEAKKVEMEQRKKEKEKQQEQKKVEKEKKLTDKEAKKAELEQRKKEKERQQEQKRLENERKKAELEQKKMERELKKMGKDQKKQSVKGKQKENDSNIDESSKESECVQSITETNSDVIEKVIDMSSKKQPEKAADISESSPREEIQSTYTENDTCQQVPDMCNSENVDAQSSESKESPTKRENSYTKTKFSAPTKKGFKKPRQATGMKNEKKGGFHSDKKPNSDKTKVETTKNKSKLTQEKVRKRKSSSLWVQCDIPECSKWRKLKDCIDPSQLPEKWDCSLNSDPDFNTCSAGEEDALELSESQEFLYTPFVPGCIVWAKLVGYPWWPAMLEEDPDEECYYEMNRKRTVVTKYHVVFFDTPVCRAWVPSESVVMLDSDVDKNKDTTVPKKYTRSLKYAVERAKAALQLSIEERIAKFSFSKCYKKGKRSREDEGEVQVTTKKCRTNDQDGNKSDDSTTYTDSETTN